MVMIQKAKRPREELCKVLGIRKVLGDDSSIREANKVALIQGIREDRRSISWMTNGFILMHGTGWIEGQDWKWGEEGQKLTLYFVLATSLGAGKLGFNGSLKKLTYASLALLSR
jgi:hypothetical protein